MNLSDAISLEQLYNKVDLAFHCSFWKLVFVLKNSKQEKMKIILEKEKLSQK